MLPSDGPPGRRTLRDPVPSGRRQKHVLSQVPAELVVLADVHHSGGTAAAPCCARRLCTAACVTPPRPRLPSAVRWSDSGAKEKRDGPNRELVRPFWKPPLSPRRGAWVRVSGLEMSECGSAVLHISEVSFISNGDALMPPPPPSNRHSRRLALLVSREAGDTRTLWKPSRSGPAHYASLRAAAPHVAPPTMVSLSAPSPPAPPAATSATPARPSSRCPSRSSATPTCGTRRSRAHHRLRRRHRRAPWCGSCCTRRRAPCSELPPPASPPPV